MLGGTHLVAHLGKNKYNSLPRQGKPASLFPALGCNRKQIPLLSPIHRTSIVVGDLALPPVHSSCYREQPLPPPTAPRSAAPHRPHCCPRKWWDALDGTPKPSTEARSRITSRPPLCPARRRARLRCSSYSETVPRVSRLQIYIDRCID